MVSISRIVPSSETCWYLTLPGSRVMICLRVRPNPIGIGTPRGIVGATTSAVREGGATALSRGAVVFGEPESTDVGDALAGTVACVLRRGIGRCAVAGVRIGGRAARLIEIGSTLSAAALRALCNDVMERKAVANTDTVAAAAIAGLNHGDDSPRYVHDRRRTFTVLERPGPAPMLPNLAGASAKGNRADADHPPTAQSASYWTAASYLPTSCSTDDTGGTSQRSFTPAVNALNSASCCSGLLAG